MARRECTQEEFIDYQLSIVSKSQERIKRDFAKLSHGQMQALINEVEYARKMIGFAKSGKMSFYFI